MSPEPVTARDGRWLARRSPRSARSRDYSPALRRSSYSPPQKYRRGSPSPRFQQNTEAESNRTKNYRPPPAPSFGRSTHHSIAPPLRAGVLPPPPPRKHGNFGHAPSPRNNSISFPNPPHPPPHSGRYVPVSHNSFTPRFPVRDNSPPPRYHDPRNEPYLRPPSPMYRRGRSRERSRSPSRSTPSHTRSRSTERYKTYKTFQRSRSTSRARSRSLSRSRSSRGSRSPYRVQHRNSRTSRSVSHSPPYRQHYMRIRGWRRRRLDRSPSPLVQSSTRSRSTSRSRSVSRGRARLRTHSPPRSRSPSLPISERRRWERHGRRVDDPIDSGKFHDGLNDRPYFSINQPERFHNDRGYPRGHNTNGFYNGDHGPGRAPKYVPMNDNPHGGRGYPDSHMYPDRSNALFRRPSLPDTGALGWEDRRGQSQSGLKNRQRGRRDRRRKERERERGRDRERERKRDRDRDHGESLPQIDRRTVDDLLLHALRISLRYRRPPFNISVISDLLSDITDGWSIRRTEFSSFSQLCRAAENRHWLKLGRKGESVVLLGSNLFPPASRDAFGPDGHLDNVARRQREQDILDVRRAYKNGRLQTPDSRLSVESVAADIDRTDKEGSNIEGKEQRDSTAAGFSHEHNAENSTNVVQDSIGDDRHDSDNVHLQGNDESPCGRGDLSNESAASERCDVVTTQDGFNEGSEFGTREGTEGDLNTSEEKHVQNQIDDGKTKEENLGWLDKSALTVDISNRDQEGE